MLSDMDTLSYKTQLIVIITRNHYHSSNTITRYKYTNMTFIINNSFITCINFNKL